MAKKIIKEYDNNLEIVVNNFICEYHYCGSHQMKLSITIEKDELINFLEQFDITDSKISEVK